MQHQKDLITIVKGGTAPKMATGRLIIFLGVLLTVGYVTFAEYLAASKSLPEFLIEGIAILWYLSIYSALVRGLWQMSLRAYATRHLSIIELEGK